MHFLTCQHGLLPLPSSLHGQRPAARLKHDVRKAYTTGKERNLLRLCCTIAVQTHPTNVVGFPRKPDLEEVERSGSLLARMTRSVTLAIVEGGTSLLEEKPRFFSRRSSASATTLGFALVTTLT